MTARPGYVSMIEDVAEDVECAFVTRRRVADNPWDRSAADTMREMGMPEERVRAKFGYSPTPYTEESPVFRR